MLWADDLTQWCWWNLSRRASCDSLSSGKGSPGRLQESTYGARVPENPPSEALEVGWVGWD